MTDDERDRVGADGEDRTGALMRALFAAALEDEPPSAVTPLSVIEAAKNQESQDLWGSVRRRERRNRRVGILVAAAAAGLVVLVAPKLFGSSSPSSSALASLSSSARAAAAANQDQAGGSAEFSAAASSAAASAPVPQSLAPSSGKGGRPQAGGGAETTASGSNGGLAASSAMASSAAAPPSASSAAPAATSSAASAGSSAAGGSQPAATASSAGCSVSEQRIVAAAAQALPTGTTRDVAADSAQVCRGGVLTAVTFPAASATGYAITVQISRASPGACARQQDGVCEPVAGTPGGYWASCGAGCSQLWMYGKGYEVRVESSRPGGPDGGPGVAQLIPIGRAVLAALP